jgi:hypothetical protein
MVRQQAITKKKIDFMAIFWFLWTKLPRRAGNLDGQNFWTEETESIMGCSVIDFLSEVISLTLESSQPEDKGSRFNRRFFSKDLTLLHRAVSGAELLSKLNDVELTHRFLTHFVDGKIDSYRPGVDLQFEKMVAEETFTVCIQGLPAHRVSVDNQQPGLLSIMMNPTWDATVASSLSSSTLSSMRRMAGGYSRQSRLSIVSIGSTRTRRTTETDDLSDRMSLLTIPGENT